MKKIVIIVSMMFCLIGASCGKQESGLVSDGTVSDYPTGSSNEDYFVWGASNTGTVITGLTEDGARQTVLVIPAKCTEINSSTFFEVDTAVETISFENPDTILTSALFSGCETLKNVTLPENLKEIPNYCFAECSSIEEIIIPETVTEIGRNAFYHCDNLKKVVFGKSVETIGKEAFYNCGLEKVVFPESLRTIESHAFDNCTTLISIDFADGIETIGKSAFYECNSLTKVVLPETLTAMDSLAFVYCESLEEIYLPESLSTFSNTAFNQTHMITVYVKEGSLADSEFDKYADGFMEKAYY